MKAGYVSGVIKITANHPEAIALIDEVVSQ
jgi:hypothetical protein